MLSLDNPESEDAINLKVDFTNWIKSTILKIKPSFELDLQHEKWPLAILNKHLVKIVLNLAQSRVCMIFRMCMKCLSIDWNLSIAKTIKHDKQFV